jgi:hypothetical protein
MALAGREGNAAPAPLLQPEKRNRRRFILRVSPVPQRASVHFAFRPDQHLEHDVAAALDLLAPLETVVAGQLAATAGP